MKLEKGDLIQSNLIRFYHKERIYQACVEFRRILWNIIDDGSIPVDVAINVTHPSQHDIKKYRPKLHEEEDNDRE